MTLERSAALRRKRCARQLPDLKPGRMRAIPAWTRCTRAERIKKLWGGEQEDPERIDQRGADDYRLSRIEFGRAIEARFAFEALRRGLIISQPSGNNPSYDVVVDNGKRLFKVQVKGVHAVTGKEFGFGHNRLYRALLWGTGRKRPPRFDVCAVYLADEDQWVFFGARYRLRRCLVITTEGKNMRVGWEIFRPRRQRVPNAA